MTVITAGELTGILLRCKNTAVSTVGDLLGSTQIFLDLSYQTIGQFAKRVGVNRTHLQQVMAGEHEIGLCLACRMARCYSDGLQTIAGPIPAGIFTGVL